MATMTQLAPPAVAIRQGEMTSMAYPGPVDYVNNFFARFNVLAVKGTDLQGLELPDNSRIECIDPDLAGTNPWKCIVDIKGPAESKAAAIGEIKTGNCEIDQIVPSPLSDFMNFWLVKNKKCSCGTMKMEDGSYNLDCSLPLVAASPKRRRF
jgi:hypothetical protein